MFSTMKENISIFIGIIITFLTPIHGMLLTTAGFVLIDTIFAIYVAVKMGGWDAFRSGKLWNFCPKTIFYLSGIMLGFLVDTYLLNGKTMGIPLLLTKFVCAFFIYIEIKSLDETNMKTGAKSFWVIIKEMIGKIKSIKKDINDITKDDKKW